VPFAQPFVAAYGKSSQDCDFRRGLLCPLQIGGNQQIWIHRRDERGNLDGLRQAYFIERGVRLALIPPFGVPRCAPMPQDD
jgi:hypothetical protein